jgi:hypothetical protein
MPARALLKQLLKGLRIPFFSETFLRVEEKNGSLPRSAPVEDGLHRNRNSALPVDSKFSVG